MFALPTKIDHPGLAALVLDRTAGQGPVSPKERLVLAGPVRRRDDRDRPAPEMRAVTSNSLVCRNRWVEATLHTLLETVERDVAALPL